MPVSKKTFIQGINQDDADFLLDPKDYLGALNIRFATSENGEVGKITNIEGNQIRNRTLDNSGNVVTFVQESGGNWVIGAYEDTQNRRLYWFNCNGLGNHGIYCYDSDEDLIYTVLKNSDVTGGLNFIDNKFIHSAFVLYGLLYWTDNNSQPRRINIDAAIKLNHPTYSTTEAAYTSPISQDVITIIRPQPAFPPTCAYTASSSYTDIPDGYKASYRFVYRDNEYSTFSTFSKLDTMSASNGYLTFTIPTTQNIAQDVDKIELAVKGPDGKMFVYKTWTKTADAGAISAHNAGITTLSFIFSTNLVGVAIDDAASVKPFDSVPLYSKTIEAARERIFLGNNLSGYESPSTTSLALGSSQVVSSNGIRVFKSGSSYKTGIVFYDSAGRYCGVVSGPSISIPDRTETAGSWTSTINWSLTQSTSTIPTWAKYYSVVRTKSKKTSFFLQFRASQFQYVSKDSANAYVFSGTLPTNVYGIAMKASALFSFGLGYSFNDGDVANVYIGANMYRLNVLGQYSDYVLLEYNSSVTTIGIVEIYSPEASGQNEFFYEVGNKYEIQNSGTSTRAYSVTSGTLVGDVYLKSRTTSGVSYYTEAMNVDDKNWKSWYTDAGRPMIQSNAKVIRQTTHICFSNVYSFSANGLSSFDTLDFQILASELGSIQKLILTSKAESDGTVMLAIGEQETAAVYIGESQVFDNTGSSFLAKSSGVLGNTNILRGSYGTVNPESAFKWGGQVVFFDASKGAVVRYDVNGLHAISSNKMRKYFKKVGQDIIEYLRDPTTYNNANPSFPLRVLGQADPFHEEYLINLPRMTVIPTDIILSDMELNRTTYNFTTVPDCTLFITATDDTTCSLTIIAE